MKRQPIVLMAAMMLGFSSCEMFTGSENTNQNDSINQQVVSTEVPGDSIHVLRGEVVDGSRRNIYVQVGDSTYSFELDPSFDLQYEIGETLTVRYVTTEQGDSVIGVQNSEVY
ncbi:MAG: hypothetical protein IJT30_11070 [Muribaculaceae bacterium]|nr:hypothetical protein [Muribaculaceae bacterium]